MTKKITFLVIAIMFAIISIKAQSSWSFVGPYSNNNLTGSEFETGQMSQIVSDPGAPGYLFATSEYAGLWQSVNNGSYWTNINMSVTGFDQARAVAFKNSSEILVGNFHHTGDLLSYSTRVSAYNFVTQTWSNYPLLPASPRCMIKCVAVHPSNQSIIYAGTSAGLYRFDGTNWTLIVPGCYVEGIIFPDNVTCYISGSNMATSLPNYYDPTGQSMIMISTDPGNILFSPISPNISPGDPITHSEICKGPTSNDIFALTVGIDPLTGNENRYLNQINKTGSIFTITSLHSWGGNISFMGGMARMPLMYDAYNNWLWSGGVYLSCMDLNVGGGFYTNIRMTSMGHTTNGQIHNDMHGFTINSNNDLFVANDGGIVKTTLSNLVPLQPTSVYFDRMNNNINVSLINGFSGSEQDPNLYALGCQDIVNTDIYDAAIQRNRYTHYTWENDGAFIDKNDDNLMILDQSSYSSGYWNSTDKGTTKGTFGSFYHPNPSAPFSANIGSPDPDAIFEFGSQRTIQDPFRQARIFEIGKKSWPGFYQYDVNSKNFARKASMNTGYFPSVINWHTMVIDLSFSPQTKNSLHLITSNRNNGGTDNTPSYVIKYVGPDIDDCWYGHNEAWWGVPWSAGWPVQWQEITPNYANFSSIGGGAVNISTPDLGKISFKKIETSPLNVNVVYVAGNIDYTGPNTAIKCLRYDGTLWRDHSNGIPADEVVTRMVMDHWSNDALYLTTDKAVYYRDASMTSWILYSTGLPTGYCSQMEINYKENTVRVGKYGRGIWKSPLKCPSLTNLTLPGSVPKGFYEANYITSNGIMAMTGGPTALRGVNSVILNPGFSATGSSTPFNTFIAYIHGCTGGSTSPYLYRTNSDFSPFEKTLEEKSLEEMIKVYPNPSKGQFTIEKYNGIDSAVEIYDEQGKRLRSFTMSENKLEVDLTGVPKGIYLISFKFKKEVISKKIIIE
ncbi:MAG: T9SS type A sorting domain-containing protein [Bacteroidia bacterium]|nr:T9SS type A sorting domain-containing protein [Bacteroidia bacterium]